jgi:hypothetical protein
VLADRPHGRILPRCASGSDGDRNRGRESSFEAPRRPDKRALRAAIVYGDLNPARSG